MKTTEPETTKLYQVEDGWFECFTGTKFYFGDPRPPMYRLDDIVQSLSKQCRYNGHTTKFYSVAEHCCHLYDWTKENRDSPTMKDLRTILMHDAGEAYVTDVPRPLKVKLSNYKEFEVAVETVLAQVYDLHWPMPSWVKDLDTRILVDERAQVMNPSKNDWGVDGIEPLGVRIKGWHWRAAASQFRRRFYECMPGA